MTPDKDAEEHLRAIRQLMERATIYRAISGPTALVGGLLSVAMAATMLYWQAFVSGAAINAHLFFALWVLVLVLTLGANTFFILRGAATRGEPPISAGMKHALQAVAPSFVAGGAISAALPFALDRSATVPLLWLVFYGLGLLATMSFAPRSIIVLGWAFLLTGVGLSLAFIHLSFPRTRDLPAAIMGATFGGYHLCYAAIVCARDRLRLLDAAEDRPLVTHSYPPLS